MMKRIMLVGSTEGADKDTGPIVPQIGVNGTIEHVVTEVGARHSYPDRQRPGGRSSCESQGRMTIG